MGQRGPAVANFTVTAEEVLLGLGAGAGRAASRWRCGIHLSPLLRRAVYPLAVGSQAVPIAVIGVLLVFWWGFGIFPKLVVIALICFFPVVVTTVDGLAAVDPDQLKLLRTLDASRWQAFRFAELPAALPAALSGARIAARGRSDRGLHRRVPDADAGPYGGLGREINADRRAPPDPPRYAAATVLFLFAIACFYALALAERRLTPWSARTSGATAMPPSRRRDAASPAARPRRAARRAGLALLRVRPAACGEKQDMIAAPARSLHGDARLVPKRRPRGAVLRDRERRLPRGRPGRQPVVPAESAEPLKLLAAGRVDMAISYEPQLLLARDEGLKLVSIGALVQRPLTSIIALPKQHVTRVADLPARGGHGRHPLPGGGAARRRCRTRV